MGSSPVGHLSLQLDKDNRKEESSLHLPSPGLSKQSMCMCEEGEGYLAYLSSVFLHRVLKD